MRSHSRHTVVAFLALLGTVLSSASAAAQPMPTPPDRYGTAAPLRPALEALLARPTPAEQALGYGG